MLPASSTARRSGARIRRHQGGRPHRPVRNGRRPASMRGPRGMPRQPCPHASAMRRGTSGIRGALPEAATHPHARRTVHTRLVRLGAAAAVVHVGGGRRRRRPRRLLRPRRQQAGPPPPSSAPSCHSPSPAAILGPLGPPGLCNLDHPPVAGGARPHGQRDPAARAPRALPLDQDLALPAPLPRSVRAGRDAAAGGGIARHPAARVGYGLERGHGGASAIAGQCACTSGTWRHGDGDDNNDDASTTAAEAHADFMPA